MRPSVPEAVDRRDPARARAGAGGPVRLGGGIRPGARGGASRRRRRHTASHAVVPDACAIGPAPAARAGRRRRVPLAAVTLGLGFLVGLGVLFAWRRTHAAASESAGPKRLAVLPFENLGDSADAYFADGITNEVRGKLSQVSGLAVIARGSSNEYRHTTQGAAGDRPRARGRLPAHGHGAVGEGARRRRAGCG